MKNKTTTQSHEKLWQQFAQQEGLSRNQLELFKRYTSLLLEWNQKINLTAITDLKDIIPYHFQDSLRLGQFVDFQQIKSICDIGTGAGFPGIPLKICYPHLSLVLIEVNQKKINFLNTVINELALDNVEICPLDWRTFLRKTDFDIDLFLVRASLQPNELLRMFKSASPYRQETLVYWASKQWEPDKKVSTYIKRQVCYSVGARRSQFVFFKGRKI